MSNKPGHRPVQLQQRQTPNGGRQDALFSILLTDGSGPLICTGTSGRSASASRQLWLDGIARARAELGDDQFEELVAAGAALSGDDEAVAFLCEPP